MHFLQTLTESAAPHLGLSLYASKHERCFQIPGVIFHQIKNGAASLPRRTSTPKHTEATQKRFPYSSQPSHLYDAAPSRSLLIRKARSWRLIPFLLQAQSEHTSSGRHPGRNIFFVSFRKRIERSEELSGRNGGGGTVFTPGSTGLYLIARPSSPFVALHGRNPLRCAQSSSSLHHRRCRHYHHYHHNQIFVLLPFSQNLFLLFSSRLRVALFSGKSGGWEG